MAYAAAAMCSDGGMFLGIGIFAVVAVVVVVAWLMTSAKRRNHESNLAPEDQLTDEQFRRIEYGDDEL
jgi:hypothetical protein